jgi:ABC-type transporter Mla subunit MlaD
MSRIPAVTALAAILALATAAQAGSPSPKSIEKAKKDAVATAPAAGELRKGMTVKDAAGVRVGKIAKIKRARGQPSEVLVEGPDGSTLYRVAADSLTVSGDVAVTATTITR